MDDQIQIRALAAMHIQELGLAGPPFDHMASLRARGLMLLSDPLDVILADSNLPEEARDKIDGFIDLEQRVVGLRGSLHPHQHRFGLRHEVAHDVIPWQRELLHYCPIFSLPAELQRDFEREANQFSVECMYFADRFIEQILSQPCDMKSALTLADEYVASYEASLRHYVECCPDACLLLISKRIQDPPVGSLAFETTQYIRSPSASLAVRPRQRFDGTELENVLRAVPGSFGVQDHELKIAGSTLTSSYHAQSFWNGYKLFTLVWL